MTKTCSTCGAEPDTLPCVMCDGTGKSPSGDHCGGCDGSGLALDSLSWAGM